MTYEGLMVGGPLDGKIYLIHKDNNLTLSFPTGQYVREDQPFEEGTYKFHWKQAS